MHTDAKSLAERGNRLFGAKQSYDTRNQEIADNFYPARADFTVTRDIGEDWADHLVSGYPALVHRDLSNAFTSMLRPKGQPWFYLSLEREENEDHEGKMWLDWASGVQRRAMYDRKSMFTRATKEADNDFAAFGGCVISTEVNRRDVALLYRCWHLRDVAWAEDSYGQIGEIYRNWKPTAAEVCTYFKDKVHPKVLERKQKDPHCKVNVRHSIIRADEYDRPKQAQPWVSMFIDVDNNHIMEEVGSWTPIYTIPRWATLAGKQYPYSPSALIALPDARLLQSMTLSLLDAGERAANPPMIGVTEALRGDLNVYPGGFTAVDAEYDERLGEVLRPLVQDKSGMPFGMEMADRTGEMLREAFFLNTLSMPSTDGREMTAYEVGQRVQEYIRNALPLFEPIENEYNAAICDITFETLMREGAFGSVDDMPESIQGQDTSFKFESPLATMIEREKGQKFLEAKAMIAEAMAFDPAAAQVMDMSVTIRDVLDGIGAPANWMRTEEAVKQAQQAQQQQQEAAQMLQVMDQGAGVAEKLGNAAQSFDQGAPV